jgi:hypothetical protein
MDNFVPKPGGVHLKEGHDESDLSIRGIVTFGIVLFVAGIISFALMGGFLKILPSIEALWFGPSKALNPVEQQLQKEREGHQASAASQEQSEEEAVPPPESPGRGDEEVRLQRTFPTPRLQYDDTHDMEIFRSSEQKLLNTTGKDAKGNIHIPVERAMDLLVERGLPTVSGPFVPPTLPSAVPLVPAPAAQRKK